MLQLVHKYINEKWDETGLSLEKIRQNIMAENPSSSISVSRLHRIFSDPTYKLSLEELIFITKAMGQDPNEILATIGGREYAASKDVGYKGAAALIADFERRETAIRNTYIEQLEKEAMIRKNIHAAFTEAKSAFDHAVEVLERTHAAALAKRDETYDRTVKHLKQQLITDAEEYHKATSDKDNSLKTLAEHAGAAMKSMKWWRFAAIFSLLALGAGFIYIVWEVTNIDKGATAVLIQMVRDGMV